MLGWSVITPRVYVNKWDDIEAYAGARERASKFAKTIYSDPESEERASILAASLARIYHMEERQRIAQYIAKWALVFIAAGALLQWVAAFKDCI